MTTPFTRLQEVEITTKKIGDALGLSSTGTPFSDKVVPKDLGDEDYAVYKFFQGKTQAQLGKLIMDTPVDTELALHVHNFLLEEVKKAKENNTKSIHGCCYAMLIIYFHETQFGKNSRDPIVQPPWIHYYNGRTLWDRMKQEKRDAAGLVRIGKLRAEKERKQKKNPKKTASSESEWKSESETDSKNMFRMNHMKIQILRSWLQQSEDHTLAKTIRHIRKRKNQGKEERNNKKKKHPNGKSPTASTNVEPEHEPPQQPCQLEEETPIQQPQQQPPQPHQDEVIELSSCSDNEQLPGHIEVLHPLLPKVEEHQTLNQEDQLPEVVEQPSQTVVEVVPIYPTQEIIDFLLGSEDEQQPLIPKTEEDHVSSPSAMIITEVLMSMNKEPQRDEAPSFNLGIDPPLLKT
ncbi:hypothetical protein PIB30_074348 [Stylosanthes scabra]|uniref:Uncharacterized protein n=1 Tax=Stylosanthes scabra TaxID=79078 RepID=A0ABU6SPS8_9FABA|nr:hypothetical protein [Stylosanthes scabra]